MIAYGSGSPRTLLPCAVVAELRVVVGVADGAVVEFVVCLW
jgi:hypothetical protein